MITDAFPLFDQFQEKIKIGLLTKEDDILEDRLAAGLLGFSDFSGLWQVHGNRTVQITKPSHSHEQADGMFTDQKNHALCIRMADCQTFVFYAPEHEVIGVLHAGWKGIIANAITEFYKALDAEFSIKPEETYVAAGPSL